MSRSKIIGFGLCVLLVLGLGIVVWWYKSSDPLIDDGLVTYLHDQEKGYVIQFRNEGYGKIDLLGVKVNGVEPPGPIWLGIAYDSTSLVQFPAEDPNIRFMNIQDSSIYPQLTVQEMQEALKEKRNTPIHYGLRLAYDNELQPIRSVTIRYKYLGFTKSATITRWFENQ